MMRNTIVIFFTALSPWVFASTLVLAPGEKITLNNNTNYTAVECKNNEPEIPKCTMNKDPYDKYSVHIEGKEITAKHKNLDAALKELNKVKEAGLCR